MARPRPPHCFLDDPFGHQAQFDVLTLTNLSEARECLIGGRADTASDDADRLVDDRPTSERRLELRGAGLSMGQDLRVVDREPGRSREHHPDVRCVLVEAVPGMGVSVDGADNRPIGQQHG